MTCRNSDGGKAASGAATALSGKSADDVPRTMHGLRREYDEANPDAPKPSGEEAAQALERLAMEVRQRADLPEWRRQRVSDKCARAAASLRNGRGVPSAGTLYAWKSLPAALASQDSPTAPSADVPARVDSTPEQ